MNHITAMYLARSIQDDRLREARKRRPVAEPNPPFEPAMRPQRSWAVILRFPRPQPAKG